MSKKELLSADFEGILKYFRVSLPKKYRSEDAAKQMIQLATSIKVKRLRKYEREYRGLKGASLAFPQTFASRNATQKLSTLFCSQSKRCCRRTRASVWRAKTSGFCGTRCDSSWRTTAWPTSTCRARLRFVGTSIR